MSLKKPARQFTGKVYYKKEDVNEVFFDDENVEITEEIEKSLLEIKQMLNISDDEIEEALNSRKN